MDPSNPAAWNNLANYYGHRGPVTNAFAYYGKAIEINPQEPIYYENFATTVYLFRKDAEEFFKLTEDQVFEKSLGLYREAMRLDPTNFVLASDYAESFYGTHPPRWPPKEMTFAPSWPQATASRQTRPPATGRSRNWRAFEPILTGATQSASLGL